MTHMEIVLYFRPSPGSKPEKLSGVRDIAEKSSIHIQVVDETPSKDRVRSLLSFWECRGVIVECGGRNEIINPQIFGVTPVVFFNQSFETLPKRCFAVCHDSRHTGNLAARELMLSEAEHFTYISVPSNPFWSQERKQGFIDALNLNGRKFIDFNWPKKVDSATQKTKVLQKFLQDLPKPCAIFAANDALAADVITAAKLSNITIPDDVAILGVDNSLDICEHTTPTLSSIEPDFRRGGNLAMLMLLAVMRNKGGFEGLRHRTFGDLHVVRRLSTKRFRTSDPIVIQAIDLIRKKACMGLKAAEVAQIFPCSRRMADLRFTRAVGHSILDEIQSVRLYRAKQLLLNPSQNLKSISDFCGFKHQNSLRKFFHQETGMTLSDWRKQHLNSPLPDDLPAI